MKQNFIYQYAKALFDLGQSLDDKTKFLKQLRALSGAFEDNEIKNFLSSKEINHNEKIKILNKVLQNLEISTEVINLVNILCERGKISFLNQVTLSYEELNDDANGVIRGTVKSSNVLSPEQRSKLEAKIESLLNKKLILNYQEDPSVVGGLKAQVGSYTFDDTIETHLKKLKDQMNRSAN